MRNKLVLLFVVFIFFGIIIAGRFTFLTFQATDGRLKVITSPNATIYLNNAQVGKTPFEQKIKEGEYILKLAPSGNSTESATFESKVRINKNTLTYVSQDLGTTNLTSSGVIFTIEKMANKPEKPETGEIEVQSEPTGTIVYLDSEEHGNSAIILSGVDKGQHEITVSAAGFFPRNEKIEVKPGYRVIGRFKLAIDPSHKKVDESVDSKLATSEVNIAPTPASKAIKTTIVVKETGTGFLRVRSEASLSSTESARV